jgi:hypothetical protein
MVQMTMLAKNVCGDLTKMQTGVEDKSIMMEEACFKLLETVAYPAIPAQFDIDWYGRHKRGV